MKRLLIGLAVLLALSAPALAHHKGDHERGQQKQSEKASESSRGKSRSCPDQDGKGMDRGTKEPGCDKQHDGNNGCGNEPRTEGHPGEDDNNGRCGQDKGSKPTPRPSPSSDPTVRPTPTGGTTESASPRPTVLPTRVVGSPSPESTEAPSTDGSSIPFTGWNTWTWLLLAGALIATGIAIYRGW